MCRGIIYSKVDSYTVHQINTENIFYLVVLVNLLQRYIYIYQFLTIFNLRKEKNKYGVIVLENDNFVK